MSVEITNNNNLVAALQETNPLVVNVPSAADMSASASASAVSAASSAAAAALYDGKWFDTITDLSLDNVLTYSGTGAGRVDPGDYVLTRAENAVFRVLVSTATDHSLATLGGVKLAVEYWPQDDRGALAEIGLRGQNGAEVKIACYGDSSTLGVDGVIESFNNWPNRLGSILRSMTGTAGIATYNCGSGGKKIIDYWARDNYASMVTTPYPQTEYVIICFGLNDVKTDVPPEWDIDLYRQRYAELIWQVRLGGRTPIMMTPWTISAAPIRPHELIQGELLNAVKQIAIDHKCDLIDTNAMLQGWHKTRRDNYRVGELQADGTHYSDEAHINIAQFIAKEIFSHRVIDVKHGDRLGPNNAEYDAGVTVAYNYFMNNSHGFSAQLTATGIVNNAAGVWIWSDRQRRAIYVSPERGIVSGTPATEVYVNNVGKGTSDGRALNFGVAGAVTASRPAENHFYVAEIPFGLSRLRVDIEGAGTFEFGGWLVIDQLDTVDFTAYGASFSGDAIFLPQFNDSNPVVFPRTSSLAWMSIDWSLMPVGWGAVIGSQYVFNTTSAPVTTRRMQSIVVMRTNTGTADIVRVVHEGSTIVSKTSIRTSGTGTWAGHISVHATTEAGTGNVLIQVRADGTVIATHNSGGTGDFMSVYGRVGGLFRDNTMASAGADGRQARVSCRVFI